MQAIAVSNGEQFGNIATGFFKRTGLSRIHNFHGTAEQVDSVFVEGNDGYLYPPNFADVIVRDPITWEEAPAGVPGVVQIRCAIPLSYSGHSILTEYLAVLHPADEPGCAYRGKRFSIIGRVPNAEMRGYSDTYATTA